MNFCTLVGKVAEKSRTWWSFVIKLMIFSIRTTKSWDSNLSACMKWKKSGALIKCKDKQSQYITNAYIKSGKLTSSITIICVISTFATPFFIKSRILPGVAITTWTRRDTNSNKFYSKKSLHYFTKYLTGLTIRRKQILSTKAQNKLAECI